MNSEVQDMYRSLFIKQQYQRVGSNMLYGFLVVGILLCGTFLPFIAVQNVTAEVNLTDGKDGITSSGTNLEGQISIVYQGKNSLGTVHEQQVAELAERLRARVTPPPGPFSTILFEKLVKVLTYSDPAHAEDRELIKNVQEFLDGKIRDSLFVAYLEEVLPKEVLPPVQATQALTLLQEKVKNGDLWAMFYLARANFHAANNSRVIQLQEQFEGLALPEATREYWDAYQQLLQDKNFPGSLEGCVKLAKEGQSKRFAPLINILGVQTMLGLGVQKDEALAFKLFREAANAGFAMSMTAVASQYLQGNGVQKDQAEAVRWYRKAAESGYASAMASLADMYAQGAGVGKDESEAAKWFHKAAHLGISDAMVSLATAYELGRGLMKDQGEAVNWYQRAADRGNAQGMADLGRIYTYGIGIDKDLKQGTNWLQKAAELGNSDGMTQLGYVYAEGVGVEKDPSRAMHWYRKAAGLGHTQAMVLLGGMYEQGRAVPVDEKHAVALYEQAAKAGNENGRQAFERLKSDIEKRGTQAVREWADRYQRAPNISGGEFLKLVSSAKVDFRFTTNFEKYVDAENMTRRVRQAIEKEGIRIVEDAPITIRVVWYLNLQTIQTTGGGGREAHPNYLYAETIDFEVVSPLYRDKSFHNLRVVPLTAFYAGTALSGEWVVDKTIRETVVVDLLKGIAEEFSALRSPDDRGKDTARTNQVSWSAEANESMYRQYQMAKHQAGDDVERVFKGLTSVSSITTRLTGKAGKFLDETDVNRVWKVGLQEARLEQASDGALWVAHRIHLDKENGSKFSLLFGNLSSIWMGPMLSWITVGERGTVFEFAGKLLRMDVVLWTDIRYTSEFWEEVGSKLPEFVHGRIRDCVKETRFRR
ncbi:MAG TPA: tetratricopeptide repeat protein [Nitrospira sp.]|nr:tetratricopeptide repeat protein [Nitrospira sp.]